MTKGGHCIAECRGGRLDGERFTIRASRKPPPQVRFSRTVTQMDTGEESLMDLLYVSRVQEDGNVVLEFAGYEIK